MKRLAWAVFGVAAVLCIVGLTLLAQVPEARIRAEDTSFSLELAFGSITLVFGAVGAVVASRLPRNPIGWLFLALAVSNGLYTIGFGYASYALATGQHLGAARWSAWLADWSNPLAVPLLVTALLVFPDGRPPTPRWRWALWMCGPLAVLVLLQYGLAPGPIDELPPLTNPVGVPGADWLADIPAEPLYALVFLIAAAGLVVRFRRSHGVERQQVKWIAYAAGLVAAFLVVAGILSHVFGGEGSVVAGFVFAAVFGSVPVAAGVAILRHRLYDIDVVINRTLVYGVLTVALGTTYLALVLLVGLTVGHSNAAIAVSTLAVAALFRPLRARIQAGVDRRFYRRRYDAQRTLAVFGTRLRDEVDVERVGAHLRSAVRDSVQPAHLTLWLPPERP